MSSCKTCRTRVTAGHAGTKVPAGHATTTRVAIIGGLSGI